MQKQVRAHKTSQDQMVRAKLLLAAHEHPEWSNPQIAKSGRDNRSNGAQMARTVGGNTQHCRCSIVAKEA
ncbi:MAG TPA: hypothetical protein VN207_04845 [Ktedonobacteraceae bacterium]|nr:hypothetical protein [Ktedonobacteraceae bacterium]